MKPVTHLNTRQISSITVASDPSLTQVNFHGGHWLLLEGKAIDVIRYFDHGCGKDVPALDVDPNRVEAIYPIDGSRTLVGLSGGDKMVVEHDVWHTWMMFVAAWYDMPDDEEAA